MIKSKRRKNSYKNLIHKLNTTTEDPIPVGTPQGDPLDSSAFHQATITTSTDSPSSDSPLGPTSPNHETTADLPTVFTTPIYDGASTSSDVPSTTRPLPPLDKLEIPRHGQSNFGDIPSPSYLLSPDPDPLLGYCRDLVNSQPDVFQRRDVDLLLSAINRSNSIEPAVTEWIDLEWPPGPQRPPPKEDSNSSRPKPAPSSIDKPSRASLYRFTQQLYLKDTARCAGDIIEGRLGNVPASPGTEAVYTHYREIFGTPSVDVHQESTIPTPDWDCTYSPFTTEEITDTLKRVKSKSKGPDGISIANLMSINVNRLCLLLNIITATGTIPTRILQCRTTLIPKGIPSDNVTDWRPITISSVLIKTLNRLILKRLNHAPVSHSQRGFITMDGCLGNNLLLSHLIRKHRNKGQPHFIITLDIKKAFDSVSHQAILRALNRFRVNSIYSNFIMKSYSNVWTTIAIGRDRTAPIPMIRGVKQGDPLSPLLFNFVMDELLSLLPNNIGLSLGNGHNIAAMAYADDLILMARNKGDATRLLNITTEFLTMIGMQLNPAKSYSLGCVVVPKKKKLVVDTVNAFSINGHPIKSIGPTDQVKYLGHHYNFQGICRPDLSTLRVHLDRLCAAPLKPQQKLNILKTYLLPRYFYGFQNPSITGKLLGGAARMTRMAARRMLHLPRTSASAYLHASIRDGGLGIPDFSTAIPSVLLKRLDNLEDKAGLNNDLDLVTLFEEGGMDSLRMKLSRILGTIPHTSNGPRKYYSMKLQNSISGNGLHQGASNPASSQWIGNPPRFWGGQDFIRSIQLRGNLLPTIGIVSNPPEARGCRAGCRRQETLCHVLQRCPVTHLERCRRHDFIVKDVQRWGEANGWDTLVEPHFRSPEGLRKPDLLLLKDDKIIITDIQVVWEGPRVMAAAYTTKERYYSTPNFIEAVQRRFPGRTITVLPFIIGARGTWYRQSSLLLNNLGLPQRAANDLVIRTLTGGMIIHQSFNRGVWARNNH